MLRVTLYSQLTTPKVTVVEFAVAPPLVQVVTSLKSVAVDILAVVKGTVVAPLILAQEPVPAGEDCH